MFFVFFFFFFFFFFFGGGGGSTRVEFSAGTCSKAIARTEKTHPVTIVCIISPLASFVVICESNFKMERYNLFFKQIISNFSMEMYLAHYLMVYIVYISQIICFARVYPNVSDFNIRNQYTKTRLSLSYTL